MCQKLLPTINSAVNKIKSMLVGGDKINYVTEDDKCHIKKFKQKNGIEWTGV
jgi:uncharacterized pyridoxamine 5'-phosphate oxidase family protein